MIRLLMAVIAILFCFGASSYAQPGAERQRETIQEIKVSFGNIAIYDTPSDITGFSLGIAYKRDFSQLFSYDLEYRFAHAIKYPKGLQPLQETAIHIFEPRILFFPFGKMKESKFSRMISMLYVGAGPSAYFGHSVAETTINVTNDANGVQILRSSEFDDAKVRDIGFVISVGYTVYITKRLLLGIRADSSKYFNSEGYSQLGVVAGIRL